MTSDLMEQKKAALAAAIKAAPPRVAKLLKWLGEYAIEDEGYTTNAAEIYVRLFKRKGPAEAPLAKDWRENHELAENEDDKARGIIRTARAWLSEFNPKQRGGSLVLGLPKSSNPGRSKSGTDTGHYRLVFVKREDWLKEERKKLDENPQIRSEERTRLRGMTNPLSIDLWSALAPSSRLKLARLIYSNVQPELEEDAVSRPVLEGKAEDEITKVVTRVDPVYTGTGEAASALLIGLRTAHLGIELEPEVSEIVNASELKQSLSWLVVLGSGASNSAVRKLRRIPPWNDMQTFFFSERPNGKTPSLRRRKEDSYKKEQIKGKDLDAEVEYALISYFVDPKTSRTLLALAGMTTAGTRAATEFLCYDEYVQMLISELELDLSVALPSFEVVLKVSVCDFAPVAIEIEDKHVHLRT